MSIKLRTAIIEALEKNVGSLKMNDTMMTSSLTDLGVDSLDVMVVLMDIQESTGIKIPEDEVDNLKTPDDIYRFLSEES